MTDATEIEIEELEETLPQADFIARLRALADALEKNESVEVEIAGEQVAVPIDAAFSLDYEGDDAEAEIAFRIKWERPQA